MPRDDHGRGNAPTGYRGPHQGDPQPPHQAPHGQSERAPPSRPGHEAALRRVARRRLVLLTVVLVAAAIAVPLAEHSGTMRAFAVATNSMEPELPAGSLVIVKPGPVTVGDVVVYWSPFGNHQVHRVVESVPAEDGTVRYRTAGDANEAHDSFLVAEEAVVGRAVAHVPHLGRVWLLPAWVQATCFLAALVGYLAVTAYETRALLAKRLRRLRSRLPWFRGAALVLLLVAPGALAAAAVDYPDARWDVAVRSASPLPLAPGDMATANVSPSENRAEVTSEAPRLWKEIALWHCPSDQTSCGVAFRGGGYRERPASLTHVNAADYQPAPAAYLEAFFAAPAGQTAYVILRSGTSDIAASEISTSSTTPVLVRSDPFSLAGASDYTIRTRMTGPGGGEGGELLMARLVLAQEHARDTATQVRIAGGSMTAATSYVVPERAVRWLHEPAEMDGLGRVQFEAVVKHAGTVQGASQVRLVDRTTGAEVAVLEVPANTNAETRFVSADIGASLEDGHEYEVEFRRGAGQANGRLHLASARIALQQVEFERTLRYVDLSLDQATTSPTYVTLGHPGVYHMTSEWGARQAWLETTARSATGALAVRAFDEVTAAPLAGSEITSDASTFTRLRSDAFALNAEDANLRVQLAAPSGSAELRGAWLVVPQGPGKSYDHVLASQNVVVDACAWSFALHLETATDIARLRHAQLALRGEEGLVDQVVIAGGAVTQTTGAPVTVLFGGTAQHVVTSDPGAPGTSTLETALHGTCLGHGIHTVQPVRHVLA